MNFAFGIVEQWMTINKLKLNARKTKYMIVKSIRKEYRDIISIRCFDGTEIERVETMK
jgi:hypothetical protein